MKYVFKIITALILILLGHYYTNELGTHFTAEGIIIIVTLIIIDIGYDIYKNRKRIWLLIKCKWLHCWGGQYIRFSMSYQYRIRINDKYLLVKNSNWDFFQFVGGKYKRLPHTRQVLDSFEAKDDLKLPTHGLTKDDLAVFIPAKNAIKFLDWFNSGKDREVSHWREFYEELIDGKAKVLPQNIFPYVNYYLVGTVTTPLKKARGWDCWEILQYDVLDLLPTPEQEKELEQLLNQGDTDDIKWVDAELINSLGYDKGQKMQRFEIGHHTKWVLNLKWTND